MYELIVEELLQGRISVAEVLYEQGHHTNKLLLTAHSHLRSLGYNQVPGKSNEYVRGGRPPVKIDVSSLRVVVGPRNVPLAHIKNVVTD